MEVNNNTKITMKIMGRIYSTRIRNDERPPCVESRQPGSCASTPGSPDKILQQREAGSISTQCSVSNRGRMLKEEDT